MGSVLASSAVDCGFERRSGQTKEHRIGICCFSAKHAALRRKSKDWLARIRIMCPSGATCLPADLFQLTLLKSNSACVGLVQSVPHHHLIENLLVLACYSWKNCLVGVKQQSLTHSCVIYLSIKFC